jgi:tRNA-uridine 2-sulfurtransferase
MKIAVAMSGGIDSSMAAIMLSEAGHEIAGITAELSAGLIGRHYGGTTSSDNAASARAIADRYGFPLHVLDLEEDFHSLIVAPFCREYLKGRTPNPCIRCNPAIKFGRLLDFAKSIDCEKIATGHYSLIKTSETGRRYVARGAETAKDQSYFLFMLTQECLDSIIFPLGGYTKEQVRSMAIERGLAVANRPESQEICFIPDNRYADFIERETGSGAGPGDIVDAGGAVIGRHRGIHRYTIGQRRGLGIAAPRPLYVTGIDAENNRIIAGYQEELETISLLADEIHYMKETDLDGRSVLVKARSTQAPVEALLSKGKDGILVTFASPQIGISPGQAAVFYNEAMEVLGGGIIQRAMRG